jgi:hypothetical protein
MIAATLRHTRGKECIDIVSDVAAYIVTLKE